LFGASVGMARAAKALAQPMGRPGPRPGMGPGMGEGPQAPIEEPPLEAKNGVPLIDVHAHLVTSSPGMVGADFAGAARAAISWMDRVGISRMLVMPPPYGATEIDRSYEYDAFRDALRAYPGRFGFLAGGGGLNPLIHQAVREGAVSASVERDFVARARQMLADGALGFGELSAEHLSYFAGHPYNAAPPDHPLFRLLADIAAERGAPIDLHMEAVPRDMATPPMFSRLSAANPPTLKANIDGFRRLLAHNRKARIVWAHAGHDATGYRTPQLCRDLLQENPNLCMSLAVPPRMRQLLDEADRARGDWLSLVSDLSDRFMVGTDSFHLSPQMSGRHMPRVWQIRLFVNQLPGELARRVGSLNAQRIFNLPVA
jgi:hypothetical protein